MSEINIEQKGYFFRKFAGLKVENAKEILAMASQIFLQLFLSLIITQINSMLFSWYDHSSYYPIMNKIAIFYTTFQFVPSLIASGTLVVGNNFLGQGKQKQLGSLIVSGLAVSLIVTSIVVLFTNIFANEFFKFLEVTNNPIGIDTGDGNFVPASIFPKENEMNFAIKYYRIYSLQLLFLGITQVYISSLQTIKKQKHVTIGAVLSNIIDVTFVSLFLYAFKIDPIYCSFGIVVATIFQMIYMIVVSNYYIEYETKNFIKLINFKYMKETVKVGLPITLEMGMWNICNFVTQAAISAATAKSTDLGNSAIDLHRVLWSLNQYSSAFLQAISTVTSMSVAKKVGEGDLDGAYKAGINCWKLSIYSQFILSTIMFGMVYPYLRLMNIPAWQIMKYAFILYSLLFVKMLFDTVNMTLLRALWAVGDLWFPLLVSIFTMGIFLATLPMIYAKCIYTTPNSDPNDGGHSLMIIYSILIFDPISRAIIYQIRWRKQGWKRFAKKI